MSSSFQDQIEEAMAEFQEQQRKLLDVRHELEKTMTAVSSKDHLVTVTVAISGMVKDIKFHRTDYASMAPAELSAVLVETINKAREKAGAKAQKAFNPLAAFGADLRNALAGSPELDEIFGDLEKLTGVAIPSATMSKAKSPAKPSARSRSKSRSATGGAPEDDLDD